MISEETHDAEEGPISEDDESDILTQPNDEQKHEIARWVADGLGLSDIQKKIYDDFSVVMTYMDVRFLVDDLNLTLVDEEEDEVVEEAPETGGATEVSSDGEGIPQSNGGVKVELNTVNPPGSMASGSVVFSDGERKNWSVDQFGRLGLSGGVEDYKPSEEDIAEFQKELDSALRGKGL